ncbi:uncharacterized protein LOC135279943 isoform X2 [Passer domesticus]|uniref:uncharacterized protein LOC135279943 isoform X2 n=1 Tax=Passer domesticus TaxID=48849 RepID=UPI0030FF026C
MPALPSAAVMGVPPSPSSAADQAAPQARVWPTPASRGRTQELRCRGGPKPPSQFAPGCPGKLREKSLRSPARRRIPTAAACSRSTSRFASSLSPGPWRRGSSRGQLPGSWGPAVLQPAGRCKVPGRSAPARRAVGTQKEWSRS